MTLPTDAQARKAVPLVSGCLDYFPDALAAVAELSRIGNEQHNPGEPLHWARSKSGDEADALVRHLMDRGTIDTDGVRHSTKVAWRALASLQKELESAGAPMSRASRPPAIPDQLQIERSAQQCEFPTGIVDHKTASELLAARQHDAAEGEVSPCIGSVCGVGE